GAPAVLQHRLPQPGIISPGVAHRPYPRHPAAVALHRADEKAADLVRIPRLAVLLDLPPPLVRNDQHPSTPAARSARDTRCGIRDTGWAREQAELIAYPVSLRHVLPDSPAEILVAAVGEDGDHDAGIEGAGHLQSAGEGGARGDADQQTLLASQ